MSQTPVAPPSAPARPPRGGLATLAVLLVMLGIVGGGYAAEAAVADVPARPVTVADGVVVTPLAGWEFGGRSDDDQDVLFSKGAGSLAVSVLAGREEPAAALSTLLAGWRDEQGTQLSAGRSEPVAIPEGRSAASVTYSGTFQGIAYPVEGEVTAVQGSNVTVLFDGWAAEGDYAQARGEVDRMVREATIP